VEYYLEKIDGIKEVATNILPKQRFYKTEAYHQDYYRRKRADPTVMVISNGFDYLRVLTIHKEKTLR